MSSLTAEVKVRPHKDEEYACLPNRHSLDGSARTMENATSDIPSPNTLKASVTPNDHPDGGLEAWLVLFGTMCSTFTTRFGYVNAWGVFQAYYQHTILAEHSPSSIAWIGSIQYSLVFLPGLVVGRLFDLGYFRIVSVLSSVLLLVATFLVAECTAYWQFLLCQGLATGMACGGFFGPSTAILAQWFRKRRGLALGLFSAGASVGGTVIPIAARSLIPRIGFQWTVRVIGFILFSGLLLANLTMKPRLSPAKPTGGIASVPLFKCAKFTAHCISAFLIYMGFYTLPTYVASTATSVGISPQSAFYLVSVANGCSGVGRLLAGPMADRLGPMNVSIPFTALTGLMTYVWPFTKTPVSLISITALYGYV
ncbi:hypothetical protein VKT23_015499 [Stygiomarasmius scandens]|uniref:MFS general substrate transporter n=1 Tax=Marasmiellus scandens TaxID=2682957 RepID=A0ABR1J174_9AGAR